jgi:hypothetical protein
MGEVFIAAAPDEAERARGLAKALTALGFQAKAEAPSEAELAQAVGAAKCVVALWTPVAPPAWLAIAATLALERGKLVSAELQRDATPAAFRTAPRANLAPNNRAAFKEGFEALAAAVQTLAPAAEGGLTVVSVLGQAREMLMPPAKPAPDPWRAALIVLVTLGVLFGFGFGAGRLINGVRNRTLFVARPATEAPDAPPAPVEAAAAAPAPSSQAITATDVERLPWRDVAARLSEGDAPGILERAGAGDGLAQTLACLGHFAGAPGFLPSPSAAKEFCDAASAQGFAPGLYYSWVLYRTAPHSGLAEAVARTRLEQAAQAGFTAAQVDLGVALSGEAHGSRAAEAEAGRLWLAAAEANDPRGQFHYARWLRDSPAGPRDPTAAIPFLERAAGAHQVDAVHMLATHYRDGLGTARNGERARALYEEAAAANYTPSMFNLADMLRDGSAEDRARAVGLYQRLACMPDELSIRPLSIARLRAMGERAQCA